MIVEKPRLLSMGTIASQIRTESSPYRDFQIAWTGNNIGAINLEAIVLANSKERLNSLNRLATNWDGEGAAKPDPFAIERARMTLEASVKISWAYGTRWNEPLISPTREGDVVFEWWCGRRKLSLYFQHDGIEYICVEDSEPAPSIESGILGQLDLGDHLVWLSQG